MKIVIGSGNNRQSFDMPTADESRAMEKSNPVEFVKIKGNIMSLIRNNSKQKEKTE